MRDWPDLKVLVAVAEAGSLAGAGRLLAVRHTTIGRRLDVLEAAIGSKLVDRLPGGAVLTPLGIELAAQGREVEAVMQAIALRGRGERAAIAGSVTISAPPLLASHILPDVLARLLAEHPALQVVMQANAAIVSLARGESDIALRLGEPAGHSLITRRIGTIRLGLYASPTVAAQPPEAWRFIGYDAALAHVPHHRWLENLIAERPVALRTSDVHAQLAAARLGIGVAMLPRLLVEPETSLVRLAGFDPPVRPIHSLVHPDLRRSAAVRLVLDHVARHVAADLRLRN